jgi:hypothetical protein
MILEIGSGDALALAVADPHAALTHFISLGGRRLRSRRDPLGAPFWVAGFALRKCNLFIAGARTLAHHILVERGKRFGRQILQLIDVAGARPTSSPAFRRASCCSLLRR